LQFKEDEIVTKTIMNKYVKILVAEGKGKLNR